MRRRAGSLRFRIVRATALVTALGVAALIAVVLAVVDRAGDQEVATTLSSRVAAVLSTAVVAHGRLEVGDGDDALYDTLTWVYATDGRTVAGPHVPAGLQRPVRALAATTTTRVVDAGRWRLRAAPIRLGGRRVGTTVVAADLAPYRTAFLRTALAVGVLGAAVIVGMTALAGRIVRRALAPVSTMSRTAAAWSQERLDRRFALGPPRDEISALGDVLDGLLDRVRGVIRDEQRLTAELAHELRTPLTVIQGEAELGRSALPDPAVAVRFDRILAAATDMATSTSTLLGAARGTIGFDARSSLRASVRAVFTSGAEPSCTVELDVADLEVAAPAELVQRILAPLAENARRFARTRITVSGRAVERRAEVVVGNDGPPIGIPLHELFEPGRREEASPGAGLGLALSRRLARAGGGDVAAVRHPDPAFVVTLPLAEPAPDPG